MAIPWVAWFGYKILNSSYRGWGRLSGDLGLLLLVPIGAPALFLVVVWVIAGFQNRTISTKDAEQKSVLLRLFAPRRLSKKYYSIIARAISKLPHNSIECRQALYEHARVTLATRLAGESELANEQLALESAIRTIEERQLRLLIPKKPSTALLIASIIFPGLWALDFTSMSIYWIARLPRQSGARS